MSMIFLYINSSGFFISARLLWAIAALEKRFLIPNPGGYEG